MADCFICGTEGKVLQSRTVEGRSVAVCTPHQNAKTLPRCLKCNEVTAFYSMRDAGLCVKCGRKESN